MATQPIAFDTTAYDQLIKALTGLITDLQSATDAGAMPLSGDVLLQPDGQTWAPASDLVAAGRSFFGRKFVAVDQGLLPMLTNLRDGLVQARSIFQDTEDLATISRADFMQQFPELGLATPNRLNDPW